MLAVLNSDSPWRIKITRVVEGGGGGREEEGEGVGEVERAEV